MSEMKNLENVETVKIEERIRESAVELELLLGRAPEQQCRLESAWNEGDDFTDTFKDEIWGEKVP